MRKPTLAFCVEQRREGENKNAAGEDGGGEVVLSRERWRWEMDGGERDVGVEATGLGLSCPEGHLRTGTASTTALDWQSFTGRPPPLGSQWKLRKP